MEERSFKLISIEESPPPEGVRQGTWHRYVVANGLTEINGYAPGSRRIVQRRAREYVEQLNAKNDPTRPKGPWVGRSRKKR